MTMPFEFIPEIEEPEEDDTPRRPIHRTKPLYAIDTPEERESWRQAYAAWSLAHPPADPDEEDSEVEVIERGYDLQEPLSVPGAAGTLARRLAGGGWEVKARTSLVRVPAVLYVSDSEEGSAKEYRRGDVRFAEHELRTTVILGVKRVGEKFMAVEATYFSKGGFQGAKTYDPVLGIVFRSTVKTERKPREWEIAEAVMPPWGLEQWLDATCPKPKKKTAQKEAA